jgi:hypothetical protein
LILPKPLRKASLPDAAWSQQADESVPLSDAAAKLTQFGASAQEGIDDAVYVCLALVQGFEWRKFSFGQWMGQDLP